MPVIHTFIESHNTLIESHDTIINSLAVAHAFTCAIINKIQNTLFRQWQVFMGLNLVNLRS